VNHITEAIDEFVGPMIEGFVDTIIGCGCLLMIVSLVVGIGIGWFFL
jgi:hypothetical protein